jgi:hypothetical protein
MTDEITIEKLLERGFVKDNNDKTNTSLKRKGMAIYILFEGLYSSAWRLSTGYTEPFQTVTTMAEIDKAISKNKKKMIKIEIKNRFTGTVIFEYSKDNNTIAETVYEAKVIREPVITGIYGLDKIINHLNQQ